MNKGWYETAEYRPTKKVFDPEDELPVRAVVLHRADEIYENALSILEESGSGVSAHFLIGEAGQVVQFASLTERTWANGLRYDQNESRWYTIDGFATTPTWTQILPGKNPNLYAIAIELSGFHDKPLTQAQTSAGILLLAWLGIEIRMQFIPGQTLIGHNEIDPVTRHFCPGPFVDIERLAKEANSSIRLASG